MELSWLTSRQVESRRRVLIRYVRRSGKIWIRVFPDKAVTARPIETRIGAGKGRLDYYVAEIYPGTIIFEVCGISKLTTMQAIRVVASKLPVKIQIASKSIIIFIL
jgi:large subunit ribosomal protein L16